MDDLPRKAKENILSITERDTETSLNGDKKGNWYRTGNMERDGLHGTI